MVPAACSSPGRCAPSADALNPAVASTKASSAMSAIRGSGPAAAEVARRASAYDFEGALEGLAAIREALSRETRP